MDRTFARLSVLGLALFIACQTTTAGDRKPGAARDFDALAEIVTSREAHPVVMRREAFVSAPVRAFETAYASAPERSSNIAKRDEGATAPAGEHKQLTFFHINSKVGDIAVQP